MDNDTQALTLTEFLLARIAEDEAVVTPRERFDPPDFGTFGDAYASGDPGCIGVPYLTIDPARVLAECEAKRRIIAHLVKFMEGDYAPWNETTLQLLALPYADHPEYDEAWRP